MEALFLHGSCYWHRHCSLRWRSPCKQTHPLGHRHIMVQGPASKGTAFKTHLLFFQTTATKSRIPFVFQVRNMGPQLHICSYGGCCFAMIRPPKTRCIAQKRTSKAATRPQAIYSTSLRHSFEFIALCMTCHDWGLGIGNENVLLDKPRLQTDSAAAL